MPSKLLKRTQAPRTVAKSHVSKGGCSTKPSHDKSILGFIKSMREIPVLPDATTPLGPRDYEEGGYFVHEEKFHATCSRSELAAFDPLAGVLFPGALIRGDSLNGGLLALASLPRAPITVTISGAASLGASHEMGMLMRDVAAGRKATPQGGDILIVSPRPRNEPSATICDPAFSSSESTRLRLLASFNSSGAGVMSFESAQFYSFEYLKMHIGASAHGNGFSFSGEFDNSRLSSKSNFVITFVQRQYTYSADPPKGSPLAYIGKPTTLQQVQSISDAADNPLTYVASVSYGRIAYLTMSSTTDIASMSVAINAAVKYLGGGASGDFDETKRKIIRESETKLLIMGGDGKLALESTGPDPIEALLKYIQAGGNDLTKALPISYRVNYLKDNKVARMSLTSDYSKIQRTPIPYVTGMSVSFHTNDDNKDDDTDVYVNVWGDGGAGPSATWRLGKREEWEDGSDHGGFGLGVGVTMLKRDMPRHSLIVGISPNGDDTWKFDIHIRVEFNDGTWASGSYTNRTLSDEKRVDNVGRLPG